MGQNLTAFSSDGFYCLCEAGDKVNLLTALDGSEKFSESGCLKSPLSRTAKRAPRAKKAPPGWAEGTPSAGPLDPDWCSGSLQRCGERLQKAEPG